jgi:hypothetical protein
MKFTHKRTYNYKISNKNNQYNNINIIVFFIYQSLILFLLIFYLFFPLTNTQNILSHDVFPITKIGNPSPLYRIEDKYVQVNNLESNNYESIYSERKRETRSILWKS